MSTPQQVAIAMIRDDGGTQVRSVIDEETVSAYCEAIAGGAQMPPVVVFHEGKDFWLADGFHRLLASKRNHRETIAALIHQGTRRDAVLYSVSANTRHGLRLTNGDKRRAVETLLNDPEWTKWSDREIGRRCSVDGKTVAAIRAEKSSAEFPQMPGDAPSQEPTAPATPASSTTTAAPAPVPPPAPAKRKVERGGKTFEMQTDGIGKRRHPGPSRGTRNNGGSSNGPPASPVAADERSASAATTAAAPEADAPAAVDLASLPERDVLRSLRHLGELLGNVYRPVQKAISRKAGRREVLAKAIAGVEQVLADMRRALVGTTTTVEPPAAAKPPASSPPPTAPEAEPTTGKGKGKKRKGE
jgi:uncharacterized ParB-like nuclease family protein